MSKQTATQYLIEEIKNDSLVQAKSTEEWNQIFKKAKQMEREQMIEAHVHGHNAPSSTIKQYDAQQYVNETYGGNNE
jgi:hypothetical protein